MNIDEVLIATGIIIFLMLICIVAVFVLFTKKTIQNIGAGGLSGKPVYEASNTVLGFLAMELGGNIPLIGVGGVFSKSDYNAKISRGASLVQVYTGFIYVGPRIVRKILS